VIHVCPTDIVYARPDVIWQLLTTPRELARWTDTTLVEGPDREFTAGDRVVLAARIGRTLKILVDVRDAVRPERLVLDIRLPFGVTNDETIRISPVSEKATRVTFE
jgi:hypothetical protein